MPVEMPAIVFCVVRYRSGTIADRVCVVIIHSSPFQE